MQTAIVQNDFHAYSGYKIVESSLKFYQSRCTLGTITGEKFFRISAATPPSPSTVTLALVRGVPFS